MWPNFFFDEIALIRCKRSKWEHPEESEFAALETTSVIFRILFTIDVAIANSSASEKHAASIKKKNAAGDKNARMQSQ